MRVLVVGSGPARPRPVPNLEAVLANGARVARYAHDKKDIAGHLRHHGIELEEHLDPVRFAGPHAMRAADGRTWRADRIIIAVGCRAAPLPVSSPRIMIVSPAPADGNTGTGSE